MIPVKIRKKPAILIPALVGRATSTEPRMMIDENITMDADVEEQNFVEGHNIDVDKMLEQISNDLASTKDSFSIDRSQYLEGVTDDYERRWAEAKMNAVDGYVKQGNPTKIGAFIRSYEVFAKKEERKDKREAKKAEIEAQIAEKTKSMRSYLKKINSEIDDLKKEDK